jgi:hypothetical protein
MVVSTGTRRVWPLRDLGPLTDAYSLTSDWDNQWLTGGLEPEVIAEAHQTNGFSTRTRPYRCPELRSSEYTVSAPSASAAASIAASQ